MESVDLVEIIFCFFAILAIVVVSTFFSPDDEN